jgi:hypothetical protein
MGTENLVYIYSKISLFLFFTKLGKETEGRLSIHHALITSVVSLLPTKSEHDAHGPESKSGC